MSCIKEFQPFKYQVKYKKYLKLVNELQKLSCKYGLDGLNKLKNTVENVENGEKNILDKVLNLYGIERFDITDDRWTRYIYYSPNLGNILPTQEGVFGDVGDITGIWGTTYPIGTDGLLYDDTYKKFAKYYFKLNFSVFSLNVFIEGIKVLFPNKKFHVIIKNKDNPKKLIELEFENNLTTIEIQYFEKEYIPLPYGRAISVVKIKGEEVYRK